MDISVTEFKQRCLELIRRVEATGKPVTITRRGRVVAQLEPTAPHPVAGRKPWERLRGRARWLADPGERLIVASAHAYRCELATHDASLRRLRVASLWRP